MELLRRREELAPLAKEFSILDKALKDYFCGVEYFRIGPYQIRGFLCNNKTVYLPKKLQDKYTKTSKVWVVDINKKMIFAGVLPSLLNTYPYSP